MRCMITQISVNHRYHTSSNILLYVCVNIQTHIHIPQVVLTVLEQAVGEEWADEMHNGWNTLWTTTCERMMQVIREGEQHGPVIEAMWAKVCMSMSVCVFIHNYM